MKRIGTRTFAKYGYAQDLTPMGLQEAFPRAQAPDLGQDIFQIEYNVILSATYRVPVLYFFPRNGPSSHNRERNPYSLDDVYHHMVPTPWKPRIGGVGVMGALSHDVSASFPTHD